MKLENRLDSVSDDTLLCDLGSLVSRQNALTAVLLAYLGEVDRRRLYLREACSSMHAFCTERLNFSEAAAYKRIRAARAARRFPLILERIERGELHLKGVSLLAPHLTEANHREVLDRARRTSARQIEKLVAEIAPRPDVPSRVRAIPKRQTAQPAAPEPSSAFEPPPAPDRPAGPQRPEAHAAAELPSAPAPLEAVAPASIPAHTAVSKPPASKPVTPLSPRRYELRITIDEAAHADLETLQDLLGHQVPDRDPAAIVSRALAVLLERVLARKAAVTGKPRQTASADGQRRDGTRSRHIPAQVRRAVWSRDGGRCAFCDAGGRRCTSTSTLEFHHLDNWARVAEHDPERIELRCRAHNMYQARLDYGEAFIRAKSMRGPAARELMQPYGAGRPTEVGGAKQLPL